MPVVTQRQVSTAFRLPTEAVEEFHISSTLHWMLHATVDTCMRQSTVALGRILSFLREGLPDPFALENLDNLNELCVRRCRRILRHFSHSVEWRLFGSLPQPTVVGCRGLGWWRRRLESDSQVFTSLHLICLVVITFQFVLHIAAIVILLV